MKISNVSVDIDLKIIHAHVTYPRVPVTIKVRAGMNIEVRAGMNIEEHLPINVQTFEAQC